jgi:hypothetical protein
MILPPQDSARFIRLYTSLLCFANRSLEVVPAAEFAEPAQFGLLSLDARFDIREALLGKRKLLAAFVAENPYGLDAEDLTLVDSWRHLVAGKFFVYRYLKKHAIFLNDAEPPIAYGVVGLTQPLTEVVGPTPVCVDTALMPYEGRIVCDGLLGVFSVSFGPGFRRSLAESYQAAKDGSGIITSLVAGDAPAAVPEPAGTSVPKKPAAQKSTAKKSPPKKPAADKADSAAQDALATITGLTDQFCHEHLNEEYAALCRKLAEKLARKGPSPLLGGRPNTWACGIVRTIGWVNFLDDRTQKPHMKLTAIDKAFGVGESTGQGKSKEIRRLLKIRQFDDQWMLSKLIDDNPMVWMLEVNGFLQDIRRLPREAQEIAFEKGLIPYIPADRNRQSRD